MQLFDYKNLSTEEKILLVEEIWDSISDDKIALNKETKKLLDKRLEAHKTTTKRKSWDAIKKNVRAKKK